MEPAEPITILGTITAIEPQQRRSGRVNVFIDGEFGFGARADTLSQSGLSIGDQISQQDKSSILQSDEHAAAYDAAIALLVRRPRSEREVRDRLRRKAFDDLTIDSVVERLQEYRYLDDDAFARFWIENRTSFRPRGELALRQELRAKGIDRDIVEETIADAELDDRAMAIDLARRKARSMESLDVLTRNRRLMAFLQRRGFRYDVIKAALDELGQADSFAEDEIEDTLEND